MLKLLIKIVFLPLLLLAWTPVHALTQVRLGLVESLALSGSTSTEGYKARFEASVFFAIGANHKRLKACGYQIEPALAYFRDDDRLSAKRAGEALERENTWIIYGPRRSNDYLLTKAGLKTTAMVSSMANARAVMALPTPFFTMFPSANYLSKLTLKAMKKERYGKRYGSLVDATCLMCKDFERDFDQHAQKQKYKKFFNLDVAGNTPDLKPLIRSLEKTPIDFLLLPNYSKLSGYVISKLQAQFPKLRYVGNDNWGNEETGFLTRYNIAPKIQGLAINIGKPVREQRKQINIHNLDRHWDGGKLEATHFPDKRILDFITILVEDLCKNRPKNRNEFIAQLKKLPKTHYRSRGTAVLYKLSNSKIVYAYTIR